VANLVNDSNPEVTVDLTLHFHILSGGRDDFAKLNRNASAENLIQNRSVTFPPVSVQPVPWKMRLIPHRSCLAFFGHF